MKNCNNCYWKDYEDKWCVYKQDEPKENTCNNHDFTCQECDGDRAEYKYNKKYYCPDCLLQEFGITRITTTQYYLHGECIGTDNDMGEVVENLNEDIETLD